METNTPIFVLNLAQTWKATLAVLTRSNASRAGYTAHAPLLYGTKQTQAPDKKIRAEIDKPNPLNVRSIQHHIMAGKRKRSRKYTIIPQNKRLKPSPDAPTTNPPTTSPPTTRTPNLLPLPPPRNPPTNALPQPRHRPPRRRPRNNTNVPTERRSRQQRRSLGGVRKNG